MILSEEIKIKAKQVTEDLINFMQDLDTENNHQIKELQTDIEYYKSRNEELKQENENLRETLDLRRMMLDDGNVIIQQMQEQIDILNEQTEKMKCCANCKSFRGYGETCEGWGEPVLNLNCDCTEWKLKE